MIALAASGCWWPGKGRNLPAKYAVTIPGSEFKSNKPLSKDHKLVTELSQLGGQIRETLQLPEQKRDVSVYLFDSEKHYQDYLFKEYPSLPPRRAYFVGSPKSLAVYSFWGPSTREDLRHEFTHGLLHACLKEVPLWLDEGLAEYFEVPGDVPGGVNEEYAHRLAAALNDGWKPSLERLEEVKEFARLSYFEYQQSWAWVHFLLNHSPKSRELLISYIRDLRNQDVPGPLSEQVALMLPDAEKQLAHYVRQLHQQQGLEARSR